MIYEYKGANYPDYLKSGNAQRFIACAAMHFCRGSGLDVGSGKWPLPGSIPVDLQGGGDANNLPEGKYDYVFSSHCLEHIANSIQAIEHWKSRLKPGGVLFLYLPHPDMEYWLPQNNRKHLHMFRPEDVARMLRDVGFVNILFSERDLNWSFAVVGFAPGERSSVESGERLSQIMIPVSLGEYIDKITILEIKAERISDADRRANIERELSLLRGVVCDADLGSAPIAYAAAELRAVNASIWNDEERIRELNAANDVDTSGMLLVAERLHRNNDRRYGLKRKINKLYRSVIVEEKSY